VTTLLVDRTIKAIAVDSKNTDESGQVFLVDKIERLGNGDFFLGSGHLLGIAKCKRWANQGFAEKYRPEFGELFTDNSDDFGFSCIIVAKDFSKITMVDTEMEPYDVLDEIVGTGSGGGYAKAARLAGATMPMAVEIAIACDSNSGGPVRTFASP
jgi:hypothetical protein